MLAHATRALQRAIARKPRDLTTANLPARDTRQQDSFTPVGPPRWRASKTPNTLTSPPKLGRVGAAERVVTPPDKTGDKTGNQPKNPLARRITALHFPRFAINRWQRHMDRTGQAPPPEVPVALAVEGPHGPVIHATNRAADLQGIQAGARVVDMRALCPDLRVEFADIGGDRAALSRLMLWVRRWCPWSALDGPAGIVLDTTGSDHLWGGEPAMLREMEEKLALLGLDTELATAPTHGA
ncbi:MAG: DNA polymerase Y family protein, partial [Octadecabacter sp.]|nr:DNA polymerase Y family protein [Octadecabacter sp.]